MGGFQSKTTVKTQFLATGDLLLVSLPKSTSFGHAPPDLVRGLMAAQRGTLVTDEEKKFCSTWTHVAMIYRLPNDRKEQGNLGPRGGGQRNQKIDEQRTDPFVMYGDGHGLFLKRASEYVNGALNAGGSVVCRSLTAHAHHGAPPKKGWLAQVDHLYTLLSPPGVQWSRSSFTDEVDHIKRSDPLIVELLEHVLSSVRRMPAGVMLELRKHFGELSNDTGEYIEGKSLRQLLSKLHDPGKCFLCFLTVLFLCATCYQKIFTLSQSYLSFS